MAGAAECIAEYKARLPPELKQRHGDAILLGYDTLNCESDARLALKLQSVLSTVTFNDGSSAIVASLNEEMIWVSRKIDALDMALQYFTFVFCVVTPSLLENRDFADATFLKTIGNPKFKDKFVIVFESPAEMAKLKNSSELNLPCLYSTRNEIFLNDRRLETKLTTLLEGHLSERVKRARAQQECMENEYKTLNRTIMRTNWLNYEVNRKKHLRPHLPPELKQEHGDGVIIGVDQLTDDSTPSINPELVDTFADHVKNMRDLSNGFPAKVSSLDDEMVWVRRKVDILDKAMEYFTFVFCIVTESLLQHRDYADAAFLKTIEEADNKTKFIPVFESESEMTRLKHLDETKEQASRLPLLYSTRFPLFLDDIRLKLKLQILMEAQLKEKLERKQKQQTDTLAEYQEIKNQLSPNAPQSPPPSPPPTPPPYISPNPSLSPLESLASQESYLQAPRPHLSLLLAQQHPEPELEQESEPELEQQQLPGPQLGQQKQDPKLEHRQQQSETKLEHQQQAVPKLEHQQQQDPKLEHQQKPVPKLEHQQQPDPKLEHQQQPDPKLEHQQQPDLKLEHQQQPDPKLKHQQQPDPKLEHQQQPDPQLQHQQQPDPKVEHLQQPDPKLENQQQPNPKLEHQQQPVPKLEHQQQPDPKLEHQQQPRPMLQLQQQTEPDLKREQKQLKKDLEQQQPEEKEQSQQRTELGVEIQQQQKAEQKQHQDQPQEDATVQCHDRDQNQQRHVLQQQSSLCGFGSDDVLHSFFYGERSQRKRRVARPDTIAYPAALGSLMSIAAFLLTASLS